LNTAVKYDSGGNGGVTFTNKTEFDDVTIADIVTDFTEGNAQYAPYTTDVTRWVGSMSNNSETIMNVMTYLGYVSGTGTSSSDPYTPSQFIMGDSTKKMYEFNKKQCYDHRGGTMAPLYDPTLQVYIVTHADGVTKSKFQLSAVEVIYIPGALPKLYAKMRFKFEEAAYSRIKATVPFDGGTFYYSLSTGQEITGDGIASDAWDIAFTRGENGGLMRTILTNSGVTASALGSNGQGGVWYTDKFDLDDAGMGDKAAEGVLADYTTDQTRWVQVMSPPATSRPLNIMTYVGYQNEEDVDGSEEHPLSGTEEASMPYLYDKKQFYRMLGFTFPSTGQVYIIRHGDGEHYSKIQIEYTNGDGDEYDVQYLNLQ
jgi:hypothetical protein